MDCSISEHNDRYCIMRIQVFLRLNMMLHCVIFSGCVSVYNDEGVFDGFM